MQTITGHLAIQLAERDGLPLTELDDEGQPVRIALTSDMARDVAARHPERVSTEGEPWGVLLCAGEVGDGYGSDRPTGPVIYWGTEGQCRQVARRCKGRRHAWGVALVRRRGADNVAWL